MEAETKASKLDEIKQYFHSKGITAKDIPTAFVVHEVISVSFAAFTWMACYGIQPSKSIMKPIGRGMRKSNAVHKAYKASAARAEKILVKVPWVKKGNAARLTTSLTESIAFRTVIKPATIPGKLWATWKIMAALKRSSLQQKTT